MGTKWRPPKKNNDKAWLRVQAGDFLWENSTRDDSKLDFTKKGPSELGRFYPLEFRQKLPLSWDKQISQKIIARMKEE